MKRRFHAPANIGRGIIKPELYLKLARKFGAIYSFQKPINNDEITTFVKTLFAQT